MLEDLSNATPTPAASSQDAPVIEGTSTEVKTETPPETPRTPEQLRIEELEHANKKMQRGIDRRTRQLSESRARFEVFSQNATQNPTKGVDYGQNSTDSEPISLTRAQIAELVTAEAAKLAPTISAETAERQRLSGIYNSIEKSLGADKFAELAESVDDAFGGIKDSSGRVRPAAEALFEADNPQAVLEYLADPDNFDEAERIGKLSAVQAGKAIAKLEATLQTKPKTDAPRPSKQPPPFDPVRGKGAVTQGPDPSDTKAWISWRNAEERAGR